MICISKLRSWKVRENFNWTISTLFSIVPHTKYNHRNHKKRTLKRIQETFRRILPAVQVDILGHPLLKTRNFDPLIGHSQSVLIIKEINLI